MIKTKYNNETTNLVHMQLLIIHKTHHDGKMFQKFPEAKLDDPYDAYCIYFVFTMSIVSSKIVQILLV